MALAYPLVKKNAPYQSGQGLIFNLDKKNHNQSVTQNLGLGIVKQDFFYYVVEYSKGGLTGNFQKDPYTIKDSYLRERVYTHLERFFYNLLPYAQQCILRFIQDRTWGWQKEEEKIRKQHFHTGIDNISQGCGLSRPAIDKALQEVVELGFVKIKDNNRYSLDINNISDWVKHKDKGLMGYREPKSLTQVKKCKPALQEQDEKCKASLPPYKENKNTKKLISYKPVPAEQPVQENRNFSIPELEERSQKFASERKEKFLKKLKNKQEIKVPDIEKFWNLSISERKIPTILIPWTGKVRGQVKNFLKTEYPDNLTHFDFFKFAVENWALITKNHIDYFNSCLQKKGKTDFIHVPQYPDIGFMMSFKSFFLSAFQRQKAGRLRSDWSIRLDMESDGYTEQEIEQVVLEAAKKEMSQHLKTERLDRQLEDLKYREAELRRKESDLMHRQALASKQNKTNDNPKHLPVLTNPVFIDPSYGLVEVEAKAPDKDADPFLKLPESVQTFGREMYEKNKHWCMPDMVVFTIEEFGLEKAYESFPVD